MKPPNSLTDQELLEYADEHITYEIEMLIRTTSIMSTSTLGRLKDVHWIARTCNNAIISSFALQARNLIDFLYIRELKEKGEHPKNIVVQDYIIDPVKLSDHLPLITDRLKKARKKCNEQAAHLTLDRIEYEKKGKRWNMLLITIEIINAFRAIEPVFPETKISKSFREIISKPDLFSHRVKTNIIYSEEKHPIGITICEEN